MNNISFFRKIVMKTCWFSLLFEVVFIQWLLQSTRSQMFSFCRSWPASETGRRSLQQFLFRQGGDVPILQRMIHCQCIISREACPRKHRFVSRGPSDMRSHFACWTFLSVGPIVSFKITFTGFPTVRSKSKNLLELWSWYLRVLFIMLPANFFLLFIC